jgi:hypothetical protein
MRQYVHQIHRTQGRRPCMRQFVQLSLVHTDVDVTCRMRQYVHQFRITHGRQHFMRQCVHLHSLLTLMVHTSACKPINVYKLTCLLMQFLLTLALLASVQAVCTPVSTGDVNAGMCTFMC